MSEPQNEPPVESTHETVDDLRRTLMQEHQVWQTHCTKLMNDTKGRTHSDLEKLAVTGTMMSANYSYALAAVLGLVQRIGPTGLGLVLSHALDDLLADGDFEDLNGDIRQAPYTPQ